MTTSHHAVVANNDTRNTGPAIEFVFVNEFAVRIATHFQATVAPSTNQLRYAIVVEIERFFQKRTVTEGNKEEANVRQSMLWRRFPCSSCFSSSPSLP